MSQKANGAAGLSRDHRSAAEDKAHGSTRAEIVSDLTCIAVVGMTPRQFRDFLREAHVTHRTWRRHVFARVADVVAALAGTERRDETSEADVIRLAAGGSR